jgi:hypothetical protein
MNTSSIPAPTTSSGSAWARRTRPADGEHAGNGFLCKLGDLASKTRQGKDFMSVPEGAKALRRSASKRA